MSIKFIQTIVIFMSLALVGVIAYVFFADNLDFAKVSPQEDTVFTDEILFSHEGVLTTGYIEKIKQKAIQQNPEPVLKSTDTELDDIIGFVEDVCFITLTPVQANDLVKLILASAEDLKISQQDLLALMQSVSDLQTVSSIASKYDLTLEDLQTFLCVSAASIVEKPLQQEKIDLLEASQTMPELARDELNDPQIAQKADQLLQNLDISLDELAGILQQYCEVPQDKDMVVYKVRYLVYALDDKQLQDLSSSGSAQEFVNKLSNYTGKSAEEIINGLCM